MTALMPANYPFATHITMFVDVLYNQGTPEQVEKFAKPAANCNIIGTYAQTELAHGTNVRGIETRADYDRKTDEFVLNTPNMQAYKWWPGGCECMRITYNNKIFIFFFYKVVVLVFCSGSHRQSCHGGGTTLH